MEEQIYTCETFRTLSPSQVRELVGHAMTRVASKNSDVFVPGDVADTVYLLTSGSAQISHTDANGKRAILQVVWPGKLFGQCALLDIPHRETLCRTTSDSTIIVIPVRSLKRLMLENPRLAADLMLDIGNIMRSLAFRLASVLLRPKRQRLLDLLRNLAMNDNDGTPGLIPRSFSHRELSDMIGASRETVTVILGQLKDEGLVAYDGRRIVVLPPEGVRTPE